MAKFWQCNYILFMIQKIGSDILNIKIAIYKARIINRDFWNGNKIKLPLIFTEYWGCLKHLLWEDNPVIFTTVMRNFEFLKKHIQIVGHTKIIPFPWGSKNFRNRKLCLVFVRFALIKGNLKLSSVQNTAKTKYSHEDERLDPRGIPSAYL